MSYQINDIVHFAGKDWIVLDIRGNKALLLSKMILELRAFHSSPFGDLSFFDITWGDSTLHDYLNGEKNYRGRGWYDSLSSQDKSQIVETRVESNDNPWFGTSGGRSSTDKIFLLSIEEVVEYFGDSGQLIDKNPNEQFWMNDEYNEKRVAYDKEGVACKWWLRSPGYNRGLAASVGFGGKLSVGGHNFDFEFGVRPALWFRI